MLHTLLHTQLTPELALAWAKWLWSILAMVWFALSFAIKRVKRSESLHQGFLHILPLLVAFWLMLGDPRWAPWLYFRLLPNWPALWAAGVLLTAAGVAVAIWARLSLGTNWSGTVTLKDHHELIRTGLYSRIRHPIYTGILTSVIGTGLIHSELRDLLCFLILLVTFHFKAKREETFLHEEFGPRFVEHHRHTGMFLPKRS